ncbi:endonuclease/exonuclease/phosphatase family protein [Arcticibacter sp. MXS-1]|uniref:endonuclease/exonuclease/phosphatase family protein n=1 Tax=Arcticibacter sp. MXS-1 TaxID=3341726 RepID=UPI0035A974B1
MYPSSIRFSFKKLTFILSICISSICYGCGKGSENNPENGTPGAPGNRALSLRVMTYNTHHGNPPSRAGVIDLDAIANVIKGAKADLVAVQELDSATNRSNNEFQLKVLAEKTGMNYFFAKAIPYEGGGYGIGILSRYPISNAKNIPLPEDLSVGNYEDRAFALVKVTLPDSREIYFGSTHLDVNKEENRILQAQKIVEVASALKAPVIIGGDMNARMESQAMGLLSNYFVSASKKMEPTIPNVNPTRKIDHIMYVRDQDFTLTYEEVVRSASYPSDHLPFFVDLSVSAK